MTPGDVLGWNSSPEEDDFSPLILGKKMGAGEKKIDQVY